MEMIVHQAVRMDLPSLAAGFSERGQKTFIIGIIPEYLLPPVSAIHFVIHGPRCSMHSFRV